ncbi:unnamed protein product [Arabis nemorensis]|uniref:Uncharacterized protein n=1 Tax=Arabis nemorensis TaxID=586526 RepID=A0A565C807_9BRAS|nr:unnamed protein product [Arabis nemorensis]
MTQVRAIVVMSREEIINTKVYKVNNGMHDLEDSTRGTVMSTVISLSPNTVNYSQLQKHIIAFVPPMTSHHSAGDGPVWIDSPARRKPEQSQFQTVKE